MVVLLNFQEYYLLLASILFLMFFISYKYIKKKIGGADLKIISILTIFFGPNIVYILFYSSFIALIYILIKRNKKIKIPFVPFIFLGVLIVTIF